MRKISSLLILLIFLYPLYLHGSPIIVKQDSAIQQVIIVDEVSCFALLSTNFNQTDNTTVPMLISPENACIIEEHQPITFKWTNVSDAENYTLQIDNSRYFNSSDLIEIKGINNTEYTLKEGLPLGNWYWHVYAVFENKQVCSEVRVIIVILPIPILISPENSSDFLEGDPITFKWTNVSGAENYTLQIDTTRYFNSSDLIEIRGINSTEYTLKEGLSFGIWYWHICAVFKDGQITFSEIRVIYVSSLGIPKVTFESFLRSMFYYWLVALLGVAFIFIYSWIISYRGRRSRNE